MTTDIGCKMNEMDSVQAGIERFLGQLYGEHRIVTTLEERSSEPQGWSGSQIRYYRVTNRDLQGNIHQDMVVSKNAVLLERHILQMLSAQQCAVPCNHIADMIDEGRALIYMPYLDPLPPHHTGHAEHPLTLSIAKGLAGIHAANCGHRPAWLPRTGDDWLGRLWLRAWREQWGANLAEPEFAAEFGAYTERLDAASAKLLVALDALVAEGDALTLLNVDLHPDHIRFWQGEARFIDWEQASYGPLYLDLPNYFTVETALVYRDALARQGIEIPPVEFIERYHAVSHYMGLRYLGYALSEWAAGGERRRQGRWFLYYTFSLALHGR